MYCNTLGRYTCHGTQKEPRYGTTGYPSDPSTHPRPSRHIHPGEHRRSSHPLILSSSHPLTLSPSHPLTLSPSHPHKRPSADTEAAAEEDHHRPALKRLLYVLCAPRGFRRGRRSDYQYCRVCAAAIYSAISHRWQCQKHRRAWWASFSSLGCS